MSEACVSIDRGKKRIGLPNTANKNEIESGSTGTPMVDRPSTALGDEPLSEAASADTRVTGESVPYGPGGRFWLGIFVGGVAGLPLVWLLAYAATLPFFIGLFFFALFGLVIGAVVHRVASAGRPYARRTVWAGTIVLVAAGWLVSIFVEGRALPMDFARNAPDWTLNLHGRTRDQFVQDVADRVRLYMLENYPPAGTLGYVRWIVTSGEFPQGSIADVKRTWRVPQRKGWWMVRVLLSIGLFSFGISTQTFLLRLRCDPAAVRSSDDSTA